MQPRTLGRGFIMVLLSRKRKKLKEIISQPRTLVRGLMIVLVPRKSGKGKGES